MNKAITMLAAGVALSAMLGGCGGSSGSAAAEPSASSGGAVAEPPATSMTPPSGGSMNAFVAEVSRILGTTSDTAEPASTEQVNVTTPEDKEPAPVG